MKGHQFLFIGVLKPASHHREWRATCRLAALRAIAVSLGCLPYHRTAGSACCFDCEPNRFIVVLPVLQLSDPVVPQPDTLSSTVMLFFAFFVSEALVTAHIATRPATPPGVTTLPPRRTVRVPVPVPVGSDRSPRVVRPSNGTDALRATADPCGLSPLLT